MAPKAMGGSEGAVYRADIHVLDGNADSVEFCPIAGYEDVLAVGTYTLITDEEDAAANGGNGNSRRVGSLFLFGVEQAMTQLEEGGDDEEDRDASATGPPPYVLVKKHVQLTCGIFDLKWSPTEVNGRPCLAQASADGTVSFHGLTIGDERCGALSEIAKVDCGSAMCLSVDWYSGGHGLHSCGAVGGDGAGGISSLLGDRSRRHQQQEQRFSRDDADAGTAAVCGGGNDLDMAVSLSDGSISTIRLGPSDASVVMSWSAHTLEVWTASFDTWHPSTLFSGADDCVFKGWDLRCGDTSRLIFKDVRSHSMGVCCIQSSPLREHVLCTGSYDEKVRLWDSRMIGRPTLVHSIPTGGGVWRVRWHPWDPSLLLCALMHNGFAILDIEGEGELGSRHVEVAERYTSHTSLGYGADWCRGRQFSGARICEKDAAAVGEEVVQNDVCGDNVEAEEGTHDGKRSSLIATCSFYDRQLHLWRSAAVAGKGCS